MDAVFPKAVSDRLLSRLDLFRAQPQMILEVGCGTGYCLRALQKRYPKAYIFGLDLSKTMLQKARGRLWYLPFRRKLIPSLVCGHSLQLPFKAQAFDLIYSNLALPWCEDLVKEFSELYRVLRPEGLLLISTLGLETFQELSDTNQDDKKGFRDIHEVGNALTAAHFTDVVMDTDYFCLYYKDIDHCRKGLKQLGFHTLLPENGTQSCDHKSPFSLTWEVIYGQAWRSGQTRGRGCI